MTHPGDLLSALLDNELSLEERARVKTHLEACRECRIELETTSAMRDTLRELPMLDPPPGLLPQPSPARHGWLRPAWGWAAAGATALALSVGLVMGTASTPQPMDLDTFAEQHTARVLVQPGVQTVRAVVGTP